MFGISPSNGHSTPLRTGCAEGGRVLWPLPALLVGVLAGSALQLWQPELWVIWVYGAALLAAGGIGACVLFHPPLRGRWLGQLTGPSNARLAWGSSARWLVTLAWAVVAVFALCGLRASMFAGQGMPAAMEGHDVRITAVVAAMPQRTEAGVRLRLQVESAEWPSATSNAGRARAPELPATAPQVPPLIDVSWYGGVLRDAQGLVDLQRQPPELRAGERWRMTVRLKAPHGLRNPNGFDYELWLWEQGVQATGYVRAGPKDQPPERLGATWQHPVEQWRQSVRDAIFQRLASSPAVDEEASAQRVAGVVAALVTGDQRAIDRADWDIFRATGVAHLMRIR